MKDAHEASDAIIAKLVSQKKLTYFNLVVDDGQGNIFNCYFTPTAQVKQGHRFMAVEDYLKIILLLKSHPKISQLSYNDKEGMILAIFECPELEEAERLDDRSVDTPVA